MVAVPPVGDVRLSAVASDLRVHEDFTLAPQPAEDRDGRILRVARDISRPMARPGAPYRSPRD
jgi:hypothetical protein